MVNDKYAIAYSEILEILKYIPIEDYNKIPKKKIELFETNANKGYVFNYNPSKTLQEQNVSDIAMGIIIILFRDFWATDKQRQEIINKQKYDRNKLDEKKREKYNPEHIFRKKENNTITEMPNKQEATALVKYHNIKWYENVITKIRSFFNKS